MHWNHRVLKRTTNYGTEYGIVEVYYKKGGSILGWTSDFEAPYGEDLEELRENIEYMLNCIDKPILDEAELEEQMKGQSVVEDDEEYETFESAEELIAALDKMSKEEDES